MKLKPFEEAALRSGFDPIEVIFAKGSEVKCMVAADMDPECEHEMVLFNSEGKAFYIPKLTKEKAKVSNLNIRSNMGYITVNGEMAWRYRQKDLKFEV